MKRIILAALVGVLAYSAYAGQKPQAWIVLNFRLANGQPGKMAFKNPLVPDLTLDECKADLPGLKPNLIDMAITREPMLRGAKFESAHCVMSVQDPIKPQ
tara:strand:+ start:347 stop:646 length:300 start_codon:yes stop_codon:yes gene_type:complete